MPTTEIHKTVKIPAGAKHLEGILQIPKSPRGIVLFAHGSGSGRHSVRNSFVASVLRASGMGTLLFDLLTEEEALDRRNVFDINLLSERLLHATEYTRNSEEAAGLSIGYFGASTGAAAALQASIMTDMPVKAVVSRGGRPDMVIHILDRVRSPTLLIVGGNDFGVIELNRAAYDRLRCEKEFKVVEGATHLFEEPGKLEEVAKLATAWFKQHLS